MVRSVPLLLLSLATTISLPTARHSSAAPVDGGSAPFHLRLVKSEPAKDSAVTIAPKAIKLWFSEDVTVAVSSITLEAAGGTSVAMSKARNEGPDATLLLADVTGALAPGSYVVKWRAASRDGHPVRGEFSFSVAKP